MKFFPYVFIINLVYSIFELYVTGISNPLAGITSFFSEQCDKKWITENINGLQDDLDSSVFGQDLASDVILGTLRNHLERTVRKKPLVLNFHGWPGVGKSYVADFIVQHWFKEGGKSKFMKKYTSKINFPFKSDVAFYQEKLKEELKKTIDRCPRAMFLFDEVDKYPFGVLEGISIFLDETANAYGYDFREAIFIFITNNGNEDITNILIEKRRAGVPRDKLKLRDFEGALNKSSFNELGGFYQSRLLENHLIDHFVPFLPLEREHVESCIKLELAIQGRRHDYFSNFLTNLIRHITQFGNTWRYTLKCYVLEYFKVFLPKDATNSLIRFLNLEEKPLHLLSEEEIDDDYLKDQLNFIKDAVREILEDMTFTPDGLYSVSGCKTVSDKVAIFLEKERRKRKIITNHLEL